MNIQINTKSKTITIKESIPWNELREELEKRFTKVELDEYLVIPDLSYWTNPITINPIIYPSYPSYPPTYPPNYPSYPTIITCNNGTTASMPSCDTLT